jgi:glycosyltransferase involved in cell wall biosynthesis
MESFSIVIMESWLAGVPVLAHDDCAVTRYHCQQSNGGLTFSEAEDFAACLDWFLAHPEERAQLGQQGRSYVRRYYTQSAVTQRVLEALHQWLA